MPVTVWVDFPSRIIAEGLAMILTGLGYTVQFQQFPDADVSLRAIDLARLDGLSRPPSLPTLAVISGHDRKADPNILFHLGYKGFLSPTEGVDELQAALAALTSLEATTDRCSSPKQDANRQ